MITRLAKVLEVDVAVLLITPNDDVVNGVVDVRMGAESDSYKAEILNASIDGKPLKVNQNCVNNIDLTKGESRTLFCANIMQ